MPFECACMISFVADMAQGPLGVFVSFASAVLGVTIWIVAPESAHASSSAALLKQEN